jgi:hypothetical protein
MRTIAVKVHTRVLLQVCMLSPLATGLAAESRQVCGADARFSHIRCGLTGRTEARSATTTSMVESHNKLNRCRSSAVICFLRLATCMRVWDRTWVDCRFLGHLAGLRHA